MEQVAFIVWRESVEALLVVGILFAWLRGNQIRAGLPYLWGGVALGLVLSGLLALVLLGVSRWLSDVGQEYFFAVMPLLAAALIVQMVVWMRRHGRTLKKDLEGGLAARAETASWWGMLALVALAVAREGSETVVFLYGSIAGQPTAGTVLAGLGGFVAALGTFALLQLGRRWMSWRWFFRITEIMLLLLAGAMLNAGLERLIGMGVLPALVDPLWDSSALLDDSASLGKILADFAGYRAHPALSLLLAWLAYWFGAFWLMRRASAGPATLR